MRHLLPLLLVAACPLAFAQRPVTTALCACAPELILLTEHTDVHDRNFTETADTAITFPYALLGTEGLTDREKRTVIKALGLAREHDLRSFQCDKAFIAAACNAAGKRFCLASITLRPAGTNQFLAEGSVFVTLTYRAR